MLPVQVKIVSSSSCTLSEASALLKRFLSSDACSDSFARDYVANVAQALQDSISRRSGGPESGGKYSAHPHFPTPSESPSRSSTKHLKQSILRHGNKNLVAANKLIPSGLGGAHTDENQSLSSAEDVGQDADVVMDVGSAMPEAKHAFKRHKKKRRHSGFENGVGMDHPPTFEMEGSALMHHDKKRRKKENHENIGTEDYGPDDQKHHDGKRSKRKEEIGTEKLAIEYPAPDNQTSDGKKKRKKEKLGEDRDDMDTLRVPENRGPPISLSQAKRKVEVPKMDANSARVSGSPMSAKVEEHAGSSERKQKEGKAFRLATPDKVLSFEKNREETDIEASPLELENLASEGKRKNKKKRRRKEEFGKLVRQTTSD